MTKYISLLILWLALVFDFSEAQSIETQREDIHKILDGKQAKVGVAIWGSGSEDTLSINGDWHLPM